MEGGEKETSSGSWQHSTMTVTAWLYSMSLTGWLLTAAVVLIPLWMWRSYRSFSVFKKMGVPGRRPLPLFGHTMDFFRWGFSGTASKHAEHHGKIFGIFTSQGPALFTTDLDMIKDILVKKFHYFSNRTAKGQMNYKPWEDSLLELRGDRWKHVRSVLSPTFSSGKIKRVAPAIQRVCVTLKDHLNEMASKEEMIELKEICGCFTMDVIGEAVFGIDVSSFHNPDHPFIKHAYSILNPNKLQLTLLLFFPKLADLIRKCGVSTSMKEALDFFLGVTDRMIKDRQQDTEKHHDFLQLLLEVENEEDRQSSVDSEIDHGDQLTTSSKWTRKGITKDEIQANTFLFLLAGYDTVATVMSFTLFCLANNPECLRAAQEEVDRKLGKKLVDYDLANELTYLDMCINEAMRLYPPGFMLSRAAAEDVEIGGFKIPQGMTVIIPVVLLHKDPMIWPEPDKFDPLRHTPEARAEHHPCSFMPFGIGPRNCIGMRLGQLEERMAVATVLQHFTPVICEKTVYPAKLAKFRMMANDGLWVKLQKRE